MWLVTGASGFVGSAVLATLRKRHGEASAVGLVRRRRDARDRVVERWTAAELGPALEGVTGVVHAASLVHKPGTPDAEYTAFNVDGTRALVDAAVAAGARRFVFVSSIKVHGEDTGGGIDERTPVRPEAAYAATKAEAEAVVRGAPASLAPVVLRLCPVFGVGDKGNVRRMLGAIAHDRFFLPGGGRARKSLVHVATVADVLSTALASTATGDYVVADRETPSLAELAQLMARLLGRRPPRSLPGPLLRAAAEVAGRAARTLGKRTDLSAAVVRKAMADSVCDPSATERAFGVRCHADLEAVLLEEIAWLRRLGEI